MRDYIQKLVDRQDLTRDEAEEAMRYIMSGRATQSQIGGFLTAMRMKGASVPEITAFARVMREFAVQISPSVRPAHLVDMCGTGGDTIKTFNISTAASFVVAGRRDTRGKARQPVGDLKVGQRRRARSAGRPHRP